ncbi:IclR family transcriptional regulator [Halobacteriales archaeon QS_9_68_17]|nr:MAG: IclR family transcriptional regulator [Halobacteriales archaeon QS_9_68_17]
MVEYPVGATGATFQIIEALAAVERAGVTELAEELGRSKGSVHDHLATLEQLGYVVNEGGEYRLGLGFLELGTGVRRREKLYRVGRREVEQLASSSGETASLVVEEAGEAVFLYRNGHGADATLRDGSRVPLYACGAGKAILANRPPAAVGTALRGDVEGATDRTLVDEDELRRELQTVRDQGLAFDRGELDPDRRSVAAPVVDDDGRAAGAVAVSGPTDRMTGKRFEEDVPGLVLSSANAITVEFVN